MEKPNWNNLWTAFIRWKGWGIFGRACVKGWNATVSWRGWRILFSLPFPVVLALSVLCGGGLIWVFVRGLEQWAPAYGLYALSAWCLIALCVKLPGTVRGVRGWLGRHPKLTACLGNDSLQFGLSLWAEQLINFAYGIFKIASGVVLGSAWIGCDGIYNLTQGIIQLYQIFRRKKPGSLERQWQSYRFCGVLILLMHLTLTGIVFQTFNWNRAEEQGEIQVIMTAFFAFYKITRSFINIARDRKHLHPVDSSIRMLNLAQAIFAMFSLQASMFHTFGTGEAWEQWMNLLTGCTVCLLIVSMGIYMIRRGTREIRKQQET